MRLRLVILAIAGVGLGGAALAGPSGPEKRLEAVKRARKRALSSQEEKLHDRLHERARKRGRIDDHAALVHFYLWKLKRVVPPFSMGPGIAKPGRHIELKGRLGQIRKAMGALYEAMLGSTEAPSGRVDAQDKEAARQLGIGAELGAWSFLSAWEVERASAHLDCMGETPFWGAVERFEFRPTAAQLDRAVAEAALAGYRRARVGAEKARAPAALIDRIAEQQGACLSLLGRSKEAIKVLQAYLQTNAKKMSPQTFERFSGIIEAHLGTSESAKAYRKALGACAPMLYGLIGKEADRVARVAGVSGLDELVGEVQRRCSDVLHGPGVRAVVYTHAARSAIWLGRCDAVERFATELGKIGASYSSAAQAARAPCKK